MKERLAEMKDDREFRRLNHKEKFKLAAQQYMYRRHVHQQENDEHQRAVEAEEAEEGRARAAKGRAALDKIGKIAKKKKLSAEDEAFYEDLVK